MLSLLPFCFWCYSFAVLFLVLVFGLAWCRNVNIANIWRVHL